MDLDLQDVNLKQKILEKYQEKYDVELKLYKDFIYFFKYLFFKLIASFKEETEFKSFKNSFF